MTDTATAAPVTAPSGAPPKRRRIVVLAAVVLIAGGGGYAATTLLSPPAAAAPAPAPTPVEGAVVEVAEMTATLAGEVPHLARVGFAVVLAEGVDAAVVEPRFALLKDAAVSELARSSAGVLITPEGVDDLRERLSQRAVATYPDGEVLRVVLTQLVVQ